MKKKLFIAVLLLWALAIKAQADTLRVSAIHGEADLTPFVTAAISEKTQTPLPQDLGSAENLDAGNTAGKKVSYRFVIRNDRNETAELFLSLPWNEHWILEMTNLESGSKSKESAGFLHPQSELSVPNEMAYMRLVLEPNATFSADLQTFNTSNRLLRLSDLYLETAESFYRYKFDHFHRSKYGLGISIFFQGAIWIMMLYMFLLYFQNNRDKAFLFYGLYMFFAMFYLLQKVAGDGPYSFALGDYPVLRSLLNEPLQWALYIAYNMFVIHFLEIRRHSERIYKTFIVINWLYFAFLVFDVVMMAVSYDKVLQYQLFVPSRLVVAAIAIYLIVDILVTVKTRLVRYIVIGSSLFMISSLLAMFYSIGLNWLPEVNIYPINFMEVGIMIEILFFSLGLGRKIRLTSIEKDKVQQAYINQLKRNEEIVQQSNRRLEREIELRTKEIIKATTELEKHKEEQIKTEYEKQLMESEMSSLRLQMNPHFIFNSLNSIRYYILKEESEKASDYITSFARLLRMILQHSKQSNIKLSEELEALRLYLEFEQQRFENKFEFSIEISEEVDIENVQIQPMLIQPFVENSIWHGLLHKKGDGHLKIEIGFTAKDILLITIEDDGVGREHSRSIRNNGDRPTYKSFGLQITKDRLRIMSHIQEVQAGYEITDLVDEEGNASGTRVTLKIKLK